MRIWNCSACVVFFPFYYCHLFSCILTIPCYRNVYSTTIHYILTEVVSFKKSNCYCYWLKKLFYNDLLLQLFIFKQIVIILLNLISRAGTIKIKLSVLVYYKTDIIIFSKCNLFFMMI
jgi:hypothetical protein